MLIYDTQFCWKKVSGALVILYKAKKRQKNIHLQVTLARSHFTGGVSDHLMSVNGNVGTHQKKGEHRYLSR